MTGDRRQLDRRGVQAVDLQLLADLGQHLPFAFAQPPARGMTGSGLALVNGPHGARAVFDAARALPGVFA